MLKRLVEWYRIVDATPSSETVEKRRLSITDLVDRLLAEDKYNLLMDYIAATVNGFETRVAQDSSVVKGVIESIRQHQPVFPQDLSDNALELRTCCAITVGELLARSMGSMAKKEGAAILAASLLQSALLVRAPIKELYLRQVLEEINTEAQSVLQRTAVGRRERQPISFKRLETTANPPDFPTFLSNFFPAIKDSFNEVIRHANSDREELNVLWWMYTGFSSTAGQSLADLDSGAAALCCGGELANLVIVPSLDSVRQMVRQALTKGRKTSELSPKSLKQMVPKWNNKMWSLLISDDPDTKQMLLDYPVLFPLSWLCWRLHDSNGSSGWGEEFEMKTGISPALSHSPTEWAVQAFNERVTQRLFFELNRN